MAAQVNGCILILYIVIIQCSARKLIENAQGGLGPKSKIEMHFDPKQLHVGGLLISKSIKSQKNLNLGLHRPLQSKGKMLKSQVEKVTFDKTLKEILSHLPTYVFCGYSFINKAIETTEPQEFFIFNTKFNKTKFQLLLPSVFEIQASLENSKIRE